MMIADTNASFMGGSLAAGFRKGTATGAARRVERGGSVNWLESHALRTVRRTAGARRVRAAARNRALDADFSLRPRGLAGGHVVLTIAG
jgi:hypothetical protein